MLIIAHMERMMTDRGIAEAELLLHQARQFGG